MEPDESGWLQLKKKKTRSLGERLFEDQKSTMQQSDLLAVWDFRGCHCDLGTIHFHFCIAKVYPARNGTDGITHAPIIERNLEHHRPKLQLVSNTAVFNDQPADDKLSQPGTVRAVRGF